MAEANLSAYKTWIYEFYFQIFFILQVLIQFNISYALWMQTEGNQYENAISLIHRNISFSCHLSSYIVTISETIISVGTCLLTYLFLLFILP